MFEGAHGQYRMAMLEKDRNQSLDLSWVAKLRVDTKKVMKHGEGIHLPHILSGLFGIERIHQSIPFWPHPCSVA